MNKNSFVKIIIELILGATEVILFNLINNDIVLWLIIAVNLILISGFLLKNRKDVDYTINLIIVLSFLIRNIMLVLDIYGYTIGFSGNDTELFYKSATNIIDYKHNYVTFLKVCIKILGDSRIILQYINVLFSLLSMLIMKKILLLITKNKEKLITPMMIFSFAPAYILLSCSLLRESIMIFLNTLSLYSFVLWYKSGKLNNMLLSCFLIFLSAWFHSGMLLAIPGYLFSYILYDTNQRKIVFRKNTIIYICISIFIVIGLFLFWGDSVTGYFKKVDSLDKIIKNNNLGNTDYLTFLNNNSSLVILLLSIPLRIVYFYFSPMPWDCRAISVFLVFLFSSTIYICLSYNILKNKQLDKNLKMLLIIVLLFLSIVYALGVKNAGTAMRHREKMLPFFIILFMPTKRIKIKD